MSRRAKWIWMAVMVIGAMAIGPSLAAVPLLVIAIWLNLTLLHPLVRIEYGRFSWGGFEARPRARTSQDKGEPTNG